MKNKKNRVFSLFTAVLLFCLMSVTAFASESVPDLGQKGSVTVTMKDVETQEIVPGGTLVIYMAAEAKESNGNYRFEYSADFSGCGFSLENIQSETLAEELSDYIKTKNLSGSEKSIGEDGKVQFTDLKPGLYLVVQETVAEGYDAVNPFLVTVPMSNGNGWVYDVDASPKVGVEKASSPGVTPGTPSVPDVPKLPQTGQLWWPVPLLAAAGMIIFAVGWMRRRQEYHE